MIANTFLISDVARVRKRKESGRRKDPDCRQDQSRLPDSRRVHNAEILGDEDEGMRYEIEGEKEREERRIKRRHSSHDIKRGCRPLETRPTDSKDPGRSAMKTAAKRKREKNHQGKEQRMRAETVKNAKTACIFSKVFFSIKKN